jgi:serine/threonine-protein kinase
VRTASEVGGGRFAAGEIVGERFRIVGLLGRGGMGEVYRADDLKLGQPVALKFLPAALAQDPDRLERFFNEVRIARQVAHPNVCRMYDVGEIGGEQFLSMEFVDGEDLASLLRRIGRLPGDKAIEIARQLCAGVAAAHERGVLHRDLKPENVMLDGRGKVRITDFGLAGLAESIADVRSGTPAYMSPEQLVGREVTARSDVYALGLVLYELFTGRRAFGGRTLIELVRQHESQEPPSPSELVTDLDPGVERVILRCLEKDPARRPPSALAVAAALPGGDPLAAALAAGETPSPEMVAAAGGLSGLTPRGVYVRLAIALVGALTFVGVFSRGSVLQAIPFERPPEALVDRGRELLARVGHASPRADSAWGFLIDFEYVQQVAARDRSPQRWQGLATGRPPVVRLWYRESPRPLVSSAAGGRVFSANPPVVLSGMAGVEYDTLGRLVDFYSVPPQVEPDDAPAPTEPDWQPLFDEARLDLAAFRAVTPRWTPPFHADRRFAWEGVFPERPEIPVRIEAASYRGRPVSFELVMPWTRPWREQPFRLDAGQLWANRVGAALLVGALGASALLARRNLRLGRVDRRGAAALAATTFAIGVVSWLLEADHVASLNDELGLAVRGAGHALVAAGSLWLVYLALEPFVRRHWPDALISWTRLLAGRVSDPLVGHHVLSGLAYAVFMALTIAAVNAVLFALGEPPPFPRAFALDALRGVADNVRLALDRAVFAALASMAMVLLFVGARTVLRRQWLAGVAVALLISLPDSLQSGVSPLVGVPLTMAMFGVFVLALLREGLLTLAVTMFAVGLLANVPHTLDLGAWYATPTTTLTVVFAGLCAWSARAALRGLRS